MIPTKSRKVASPKPTSWHVRITVVMALARLLGVPVDVHSSYFSAKP